jgi:hypothetical protein
MGKMARHDQRRPARVNELLPEEGLQGPSRYGALSPLYHRSIPC